MHVKHSRCETQWPSRAEGRHTKHSPLFNEELPPLTGKRRPVGCVNCAGGDNDGNNKTKIKSRIDCLKAELRCV